MFPVEKLDRLKSNKYEYAEPSAVPGKEVCVYAFHKRPAKNGDAGVVSAVVMLVLVMDCENREADNVVRPFLSAPIERFSLSV
jgi:hypothetical protein